ncbi:hypothetical protein PK28_17170 (plasmid) [Hymenobacter sp. DG25B]|nr:hypothetical protein PK28_17170 [Hymenobacter sp. DG25B]
MVFSLSPSYPDLSVGPPLYFEKVQQYTAYFVGEEDSSYYRLPPLPQPLPADLLEYAQQIDNITDPNFLPQEDLEGIWEFHFVRGKLRHYAPRPRINRYVYLPPSKS